MKQITLTLLACLAVTFLAPAQELLIQKTSKPPVIDGIEDNVWNDIEWLNIGMNKGDQSNKNNTAKFKMTYDNDFIYVLVNVEDAIIDTSQSQNVWEKDCVELFFSMDTAGFRCGTNGVDGYWQLRKVHGREMNDFSRKGYMAKEENTISGYIQEWRLAIDSMITNMNNSKYKFNNENFRFEISNGDNDGMGRLSQLFWNSVVDDSRCFKPVKDMGIIALTSAYVNLSNAESEIFVSVYPNPASDNISIKSASNINMVEIYTINGQLIKSNKNRANEIFLNLTEIEQGVYLIKVQTDKGIYMDKLVITK